MLRGWHVDDGGGGCDRPPNRRRGRWRTPAAAEPRRDRARTSTRVDRPALAHHCAADGRRRHDDGSGRSSRESGAALGATGLQHGAAGRGAHASAKAVLAGSAAVVGLKGTLHGDLRTMFGATPNGRDPTTPASSDVRPQTGVPRLTCQGYGRGRTRANPRVNLAARHVPSRCPNHIGVSCPHPGDPTSSQLTTLFRLIRVAGVSGFPHVVELIVSPARPYDIGVHIVWTTMWTAVAWIGR